ncbi:MAG: D-glycero-D-manno-heptose 1,7-bisphosphate phosphatase [Thermoplasmata archaeon]|jgi:D-glycero-D-manno-heptose 1,7-bisphosphate phosphatase|nr:D-glycero-D-manno-heptose 1,7-bisphosphate phosphatase [Thermoplasmata archaeon]
MTVTVFLDRDGVLDVAPRVLRRRWSNWEWLPGAQEALVRLNQPGYRIALCTNQPWVGVGVLPRRTLHRLHGQLLGAVHDAGGRIDRIEYADTAFGRRHKPNPGMLEDAGKALGADPGRSVMVGDNVKDAQAAHGFGCRAILLATSHTEETLRAGLAKKGIAATIVPDLAAAVDLILSWWPPI